MHCVQPVSPDILWVGSADRRLALFENLFPLENGVSYHSYLILDEKTALIDTVDRSVTPQFLENLCHALNGRSLDYLVVQHMEPDHCANIREICRRWPQVTLVGNAKTFPLIRQFYHFSPAVPPLTVKEGDRLSLGKHCLRFLMAPMVHWPEVMFSLEEHEKILFSADAFGSFGAYTGNLFCDQTDDSEGYLNEARRYFTNIVGKFGPQVSAVLKKAEGLDLRLVCPLHGPMLRGRQLSLMLDKYRRWAAYIPEENGVLLAYSSIYGNTEQAVHHLAGLLSQNGVRNLRLYDTAKTHYSYIVADCFRFSHLVFASVTYNMHLHNSMEMLLRDLGHLNFQNRSFSLVANGSWAPTAHKDMAALLGAMKNMQQLGDPLVIRSSPAPEDEPELQRLAQRIAAEVTAPDPS